MLLNTKIIIRPENKRRIIFQYRNGTNKSGNPQYHCKECGAYRVLQTQARYTPDQKATILQASEERISLRGLQRVFGVHRQTVSRWRREQVCPPQ